MPLTFEKRLPLILLFVFLMLAAIGYLDYHNSASLKDAVRWQKQTQEVLLKLDETLLSALDVESVGRGYVIAGTDEFLSPFDANKQRLLQNLADLQKLLADNPKQAEHLANLTAQVKERIAISEQYIQIRKTEGLLGSINEVSKGRGRIVTSNLRASIERIKDEEKRLLKLREENLQTTLNNNFWMMLVSTLAATFSLALANFIVILEVKKRRVAESALIESNQGLEKRVEERTGELEKVNENLRASELFSRSVIDSLSAHIAVLDKEGRIMMVNNAWESFAEANAGLEQLARTGVGENYFSVCEGGAAEDDVNLISENLRAILRGEKQQFTIEYPCHSPQEERWFLMQVNALHGSDGGVVVSHYNITDRVKAEKSVRESEEFNRTVIESNPDCFEILDLKGNLVSMNNQGMNLMEIEDFTPFVGADWTQNWADGGRREASEAVAKARSGENSNFEGVSKTAKGALKWWEVAVAPVFDGDGKPSRIIAVSRDVTERKQNEIERERLLRAERAARREAEVANRMRDEFMATISHELRTPLNAVMGWAKILQSGRADEKTQTKAVETIIKNAEAQNRLIEDLLDVGRIVSGKLTLDVEDVKPAEIVAASIESVKPAADEKAIEILLQTGEEAANAVINGDPQRLQQIVWNLLTNAVKFTPDGGRIDVQTALENDFVQIRVADNGIGIKPEFLPYVFERFRQDAENIKKSGGLGLGLAIVRHLAEMHGGSVSVESEGEGMGSTFTVKFPVKKIVG